MPQEFDLIVFDWDGTLINSAVAIAECIQNACRDAEVPVPDFESASHVIGMGLYQALEYVAPGLSAEGYQRIVNHYGRHFLLKDPHLPLFDGTEVMLDELAARGHTLAIATGKGTAGLARALANNGLSSKFASTRCADQCTPKPAPDMLLELMAELDVRPERTLMIGDTTHDLGMAANAGVQAVGVSHGAHPVEQLQSLPSLALLHSTAELHRWLLRNA
ncbi:MAG TPA: HAD-IA family hydrolase [Burkholderiales bacterium]|jgi:phosphoglycolate phosphatase|nr:HAD-IA family hydrolase [Burkholderiales bacterium]